MSNTRSFYLIVLIRAESRIFIKRESGTENDVNADIAVIGEKAVIGVNDVNRGNVGNGENRGMQ